MLDALLPKQLNNDYRGSRIALWVFAFLTVVTLARSLIHMFAADGGAQSIATIPLDSFSANGAAAVVLIFALWGLSQFLIGVIYAVVLWRYRALIAFMYLLMIVEYVMRIVLGHLKPIETVGTAPGGVGDYVIVPLALVMLVLALRRTAVSN